MCGIAAIIGTKEDPTGTIKKMTDLVSHRGPDGEGFFIDKNADQFISLGHRRLSIIDLSNNGHQPMQKEDLVITYNGEVYNYLEIKKELSGLGHQFKTESDTEVILASFKEWGPDCLNKFNGMFAFVIYDQKKKKIFAARDRFGVKPFYYWTSADGSFFIASEIKQFTILPSWKAELNFQMAYDFLNHSLLDHTPETFFKEVFQLRPGHYFEMDLGKLQSQLNVSSANAIQKVQPMKWYDLKSKIVPIENPNPASLSSRFLQLFKNSVDLRLRSDVPVGSCLSGGLDSSSIVCTLNQILKNTSTNPTQNPTKQKTFSACSVVKQFDEKEFIDEVVASTGVDAKYTYPDQTKLFEVLQKLIWHQDEPFGSTSIFAQWCVFELAKKNNVTVMLDGQGADEQLAGYHSYFPIFWLHLWKTFSWYTLVRELSAAKKIHSYSYFKSFKMMLGIALPAWALSFLRRLLSHNAKDFFTFSDFIKKENPSKSISAFKSIKQASFAQISQTNLQMLLHWEDRNSMAHSVEARVPFLDYRLVEFNLSLPDQLKLSGATTKVILRNATKGLLPEKIRMRMDKLGFVTPESVWITKLAPDLFRKKLEEAVELSSGIIKPEILIYFEQVLKGEKSFDFVIWRAVCFGAWIKVFNVKIDSLGKNT